MQRHDEARTCRDCGAVFLFTAGEQEFYAARGFQPPARCRACRAARRRVDPGPRRPAATVCARCGRALRPTPRADRSAYCPDCDRYLRGLAARLDGEPRRRSAPPPAGTRPTDRPGPSMSGGHRLPEPRDGAG